MSIYDVEPPNAPDLRSLIFPTLAELHAAELPGHIDINTLDPCGLDWEDLVATQGHWRIKCLRHIKALGGQNGGMPPRFKVFESAEARRDAVRTIPQHWVAFCPPPAPINANIQPDNPWGELGPDRVKEVYNDRKGVTFHKAVLVYWLLVRHIQCYVRIDPTYIFTHVKIAPLIYTVDGFEKEFFANLLPGLKTQIAKVVGSKTLSRLENKPATNLTFCGAHGLFTSLNPHYPVVAGFQVGNNRLNVAHKQKIWCPD